VFVRKLKFFLLVEHSAPIHLHMAVYAIERHSTPADMNAPLRCQVNTIPSFRVVVEAANTMSRNPPRTR
jgi:hypothetical protein